MTSSRQGKATGTHARAEPVRQARLNKPWRAAVAVVELVLAGLAVWLAFGLWSDGVTVIPTPDGNGGFVELTRYHGDSLAGAIGLGLLAALLAVDAVRQLMLALRVRSRKRDDWPSFDEDV